MKHIGGHAAGRVPEQFDDVRFVEVEETGEYLEPPRREWRASEDLEPPVLAQLGV